MFIEVRWPIYVSNNYVTTGSGNGLVRNRRPVIAWTNGDLSPIETLKKI